MNRDTSEHRQLRVGMANPSTVIAAGIFAIAGVVLLWFLFDVILLVFAAVLLSVLMFRPAASLAHRTRLSLRWSLALVVLSLMLVLGAAGWFLGAAVKQQTRAVAEQVPQMLEKVRERLEGNGWIEEQLDGEAVLEERGGAFLGRGLRIVSTTFGAVANFVLVAFMAVLLAAQPELYRRGLLRLAPLDKRQRIAEVLDHMGETLRRWLLGQLCLMMVVALCSMVGLWLLGVNSALALGLLAGLLTFVPFIGPLIAAAVAILVSLSDGPMTALWVSLLYLGIQCIEGMLEPIVQQRAVYLPPALLLVAQLVLGVLVGLLGVVLATPLAAVAMVAVQKFYVEDVLGDRA